MKNLSLISALILGAITLASPVAAQSSTTAFAITHFNQSIDSATERLRLPTGGSNTFVSSRSGSPMAQVFAHLNRDHDRPSDLRGLHGATVFGGHPPAAAAIFARLREESREDE